MERQHFYYMKLEVVKRRLTDIVTLMDNGVPLSAIAKRLNMNYKTLRKNLEILNVEIKKNQSGKGLRKEGRKYRPASFYFDNSHYLTAPKLRDKLFRDGLKERVCECCGLKEWIGHPIPLELHHKNGNHFDNSFENLEVLCSNCHAVKHGYSAK